MDGEIAVAELESLLGDEFLHLVQMAGDVPVMSPSSLAGSKRDELFPVDLEVFDRIDGCDRVSIPAKPREVLAVFQFVVGVPLRVVEEQSFQRLVVTLTMALADPN